MENSKGRAASARLAGLSLLAVAALLLAGCRTTQEPGFEDIPNLSATPYGTGATNGEAASDSSTIASPAHFSATNHASNGNYSSNEVIRVGEFLRITFTDTREAITPIEDRVRDDGTLTLLFNKTFKVAGKTIGDFQREIRETYVPDYFAQMTPTVISLVRQQRYFVDGEVKLPSEKPYVGPTTVMQAITGCGGFTDFAKKTAVKLFRANGTIEIINCKKALSNPKLDPEVFPGDRIYVP